VKHNESLFPGPACVDGLEEQTLGRGTVPKAKCKESPLALQLGKDFDSIDGPAIGEKGPMGDERASELGYVAKSAIRVIRQMTVGVSHLQDGDPTHDDDDA
jgi:hypothetical protein